MHFAGWELWLAAALLLAGGELLHGALVLLAMAVACLPAGLGSALGAGPAVQVLLFAGALLAVSFSLITPSWWIPASWANAFSPTIALFGWTWMPVMCESSREVLKISSVRTRVSAAKKSLRVRSAITISSSDALPARSPIPLMVHSTCRAPFMMAVSELATAWPRSLWQWTERITFSIPRTFSRIRAMRSPHSRGIA